MAAAKYILKSCLVMAAAITLVAATPPAQAAGFLEKFFPGIFKKEPDGPKPEETLQAPFNDLTPAEARISTSMGIPYRPVGETEEADLLPLNQPHRDPEQLAAWLTRAISETMTIDPLRYENHLKLLATGMTENGLDTFKKFMEDSQILKSLQTNDLILRGVVEDEPRLLNHGAVQDRYRWLYEVPIMITFLPRASQDYKEVEPVNQRVLLRVQLGRSADKGAQGVLIETWELRRQEEE